MKTLLCMVMATGLLLSSGCGRSEESAAAAPTQTRVYAVTGMHCDACVQSITQALTAMEGVRSVEVSLEKKQAVVQCASQVTDAMVVAAITGRGYQAEPVAQPPQ